MNILTERISLETRGHTDIIDITPELARRLANSKLVEGQLLVFVPGSTAGLTTIEYEDGLIADLKSFFEKWIPENARYQHNERWHDGNGYAHVRAALLKPSLHIPYVDRQLCLGTWQQVVLIDFDNRPRRRELVLQFQGNHPAG